LQGEVVSRQDKGDVPVMLCRLRPVMDACPLTNHSYDRRLTSERRNLAPFKSHRF